MTSIDTQNTMNTHGNPYTPIDITTALLRKCKVMCEFLLPVYDVSASKSKKLLLPPFQ